jgi:hypothetical protein
VSAALVLECRRLPEHGPGLLRPVGFRTGSFILGAVPPAVVESNDSEQVQGGGKQETQRQ